MRDKEKIKQCKSKYGTGHVGPFRRLNNDFVKCLSCEGILGNEIVKGRIVQNAV